MTSIRENEVCKSLTQCKINNNTSKVRMDILNLTLLIIDKFAITFTK